MTSADCGRCGDPSTFTPEQHPAYSEIGASLGFTWDPLCADCYEHAVRQVEIQQGAEPTGWERRAMEVKQ